VIDTYSRSTGTTKNNKSMLPVVRLNLVLYIKNERAQQSTFHLLTSMFIIYSLNNHFFSSDKIIYFNRNNIQPW
jgi:hypothetical protein